MNNKQQSEYWNGAGGQTWVGAQVHLDEILNPISQVALSQAAGMPGEQTLDVGCGCGTTSLALAAQGAQVLGVDISAPMLVHAKNRLRGVERVSYLHADASAAVFEPIYDLVFSRFGVMFFDNPVGAFSNLHGALKPGGRLVFVCWQSSAANPWIAVGAQAIESFFPANDPPDPRMPGPFAFADPEYLQDVLVRSGYQQIHLRPLLMDLTVGSDLDSAMKFQTEVGPVSRVMTDLKGGVRDRAVNAVRDALTPYITPLGVRMSSSTWIVTASKGDK